MKILARILDRLFPRTPATEAYREYLWLLYKGDKALQALDQGDIERAVKILEMKP